MSEMITPLSHVKIFCTQGQVLVVQEMTIPRHLLVSQMEERVALMVSTKGVLMLVKMKMKGRKK